MFIAGESLSSLGGGREPTSDASWLCSEPSCDEGRDACQSGVDSLWNGLLTAGAGRESVLGVLATGAMMTGIGVIESVLGFLATGAMMTGMGVIVRTDE